MSAHSPVILQIVPRLDSGGVERGTVEVARAIAKAGGTSLVASSGGKLLRELSYAGAQHFTLPLDSKNPITMLLNSLRIEKLIRKHKVDIVHARSRAPAWSAYFAAKRSDAHFITTFHGVYGLKGEWKKKYNSIMTRGERVIAVSEFTASHIMQHYNMPPDNLRVIHRGVDLDLFRPDKANGQRMMELATAWHMPDDVPLILFPGRLTRWKGQDFFLKSLAKLPHRKFFAVLLGDHESHPAYREDIEQLIRDNNLEGHVRLVGSTPHMAEAYKLAKFVVATSLEPEAFGRVVLEAQAMGKAVIATNHGGARETVREGVTGWLVESNGVEALSRMLDYVLGMDDTTLEWMGSQGIENAKAFSASAMCDRTLAVYGEVLG